MSQVNPQADQSQNAPEAHGDSRAAQILSQWKTPANITTTIRIFMVIITLVLASLAGPWGAKNYALEWVAAVLFIIAASTDKVDGYLARSRQEVTDLGKLLDPIADKLLICSVLILFSINGQLWWWVTILFLVRELGITIWRFFAVSEANVVVAANWAGKLKTVFECISTSMLLVPLWQFDPKFPFTHGGTSLVFNSWSVWYLLLTYVVTGIALVLCLYSGANYLIGFHKAQKAAQAQK